MAEPRGAAAGLDSNFLVYYKNQDKWTPSAYAEDCASAARRENACRTRATALHVPRLSSCDSPRCLIFVQSMRTAQPTVASYLLGSPASSVAPMRARVSRRPVDGARAVYRRVCSCGGASTVTPTLWWPWHASPPSGARAQRDR